ncbi:inosine-uridine preferring nucleoside hydrolase [Fusarium heterosporum]|uniref:Inosine-uridine preferring nucleoside hydrolase n=1 Tax=Fusarium heterosporum TaxID=42747 RepID=A0A8H5T9R4_FUSHE|nr:inosine-uridine preferring nucleoside hydrolase [Fusarium heterosporum]
MGSYITQAITKATIDVYVDRQGGLWNFHTLVSKNALLECFVFVDIIVNYPELRPDNSWKSIFNNNIPRPKTDPEFYQFFNSSKAPPHLDMLRVLREEPVNTIALTALGPLTSMALAAAEDPETFLQTKELLIMGGAVAVPVNVSPVAGANVPNDAAAAAPTCTLTSANLASMFPTTDFSKILVAPYPQRLSMQLDVAIFPMNLMNSHCGNQTILFNDHRPSDRQKAHYKSELSFEYSELKVVNCSIWIRHSGDAINLNETERL